MKDDINLNDIEQEKATLKTFMVNSIASGLRVAITGAFVMQLSDNVGFKLVTLGATTIITGNYFRKYNCYKQRLILTNSLTTPKHK